MRGVWQQAGILDLDPGCADGLYIGPSHPLKSNRLLVGLGRNCWHFCDVIWRRCFLTALGARYLLLNERFTGGADQDVPKASPKGFPKASPPKAPPVNAEDQSA